MVALSAGTSEEIHELGIPKHQISCVLPGVDPFWQPGSNRALAPTVLAVGRLAAGKRFLQLLETMAQGLSTELHRAAGPAGLYFLELHEAGKVLAVGKVVWE